MTIKPGQTLPAATLKLVTADTPSDVATGDYFKGRKIVLFGLPGAFTPTCSNNHLPGYLENLDAILARGVDAVTVVAVNDHHVMKAWAKSSQGLGRIDFLADGNAEFAKAAGLDIDLSVAGMGVRCRRFSALVEDGVVKTLNFEQAPGSAVLTGAATMLEQL